jgi:hypothetical protein
MSKQHRSEKDIDALLDQIKDEIDNLADVVKSKRRAAAVMLIEYIELHYKDPSP